MRICFRGKIDSSSCRKVRVTAHIILYTALERCFLQFGGLGVSIYLQWIYPHGRYRHAICAAILRTFKLAPNTFYFTWRRVLVKGMIRVPGGTAINAGGERRIDEPPRSIIFSVISPQYVLTSPISQISLSLTPGFPVEVHLPHFLHRYFDEAPASLFRKSPSKSPQCEGFFLCLQCRNQTLMEMLRRRSQKRL